MLSEESCIICGLTAGLVRQENVRGDIMYSCVHKSLALQENASQRALTGTGAPVYSSYTEAYSKAAMVRTETRWGTTLDSPGNRGVAVRQGDSRVE